MPEATSWISQLVLYCILAVAIFHPLVYFGSYSGDGMIHLVFARNAIQGHIFEFNPGEVSGGETSPGFRFQ